MTKLPEQMSANLKIYVKGGKARKGDSLPHDNAAMNTVTWADQPEYDSQAWEA